MSVLIVTRSDDNASVQMVIPIGEAGGKSVRLDTDRYPTDVRLGTKYRGTQVERVLFTDDGTFDLSEVTAVWYRRFAAGRGRRQGAALVDQWQPYTLPLADVLLRNAERMSVPFLVRQDPSQAGGRRHGKSASVAPGAHPGATRSAPGRGGALPGPRAPRSGGRRVS